MYSRKPLFSRWITHVAAAWETVRMGEAWGQPGRNCLDVGVETR